MSRMYYKFITLFSLFLSILISSTRGMPSKRSVAVRGDSAVSFSVTGSNGVYPRATNINNGQILGIYTDFQDDIQILTLVTSDNNGMSWKFRGTAARKPVRSGTLDNGYLLQLPTGRVLAAFRNHDIDSTGKFLVYRITICSSDDNGASWVFLSDAVVVPAAATPNGVWEPYMRNAVDGSLQLYYSHERSVDDQDSVMITSHDEGKSWGEEKIISGSTERSSRDGMVGVAELGGQNLIAVFETKEPEGTFYLSTVTSMDDGATWGNRQVLYKPPTGNNAGAPQIARVGNNLIVSFMTEEDNSIGNAASWINVADAKFIISGDRGASWSKTTVFKQPAMWPGLLVLRDQKSFLYLAGVHGLLSQRFSL
ncbi:Sialidase superfamily/BNR/Asp-box repeat protein [Erysiphe neolycopersici]|uniref:Sialidase superfamily/BNR/Asp-box repeat protein n=1 Tax=Erysiphe neolycopersici TaxID=212602 RepID=A0A420HTZ1_9PEZI|nr:Sialidase superfamily/BNR/Asp-box repeat protein [Erysiphe neolycopersici]